MAHQNFKTYERTTTEVLDYKFDFASLTNGSGTSDVLADGETITSHTVSSSDTDLVIDSSSVTDSDTSVTVWVSGGDITDSVYFVDCHIVTSAPREHDSSIKFIPVKRRGI